MIISKWKKTNTTKQSDNPHLWVNIVFAVFSSWLNKIAVFDNNVLVWNQKSLEIKHMINKSLKTASLEN